MTLSVEKPAAVPPSSCAVLLVGCGKMGGALLRGWLGQGIAAERIFVVDPVAAVNEGAVPPGVTAFASLADLPATLVAEVVVLAIKPQMMAEVVPACRFLVRPGTVFLSIAAGKPVAFFRGILGREAAVVRAMPNTPAAIGCGMTVLYAPAGVSAAQRSGCQLLVEATGLAAWLDDEAGMDAVTALSGSGPAYVFHLVEAMAAAGEAAGLPADLSLMLARQTVAGSGALLQQSPESPEQLRINVTSPGGTTAAGLSVLMNPESGLPRLMEETVAAAARRSRELA